MSKTYAYIGNWSFPKDTRPMGVTVAEYAPEGTFSVKGHAFPELNFGAACLDEERGILYCVNERPEVEGVTLGGQVFALKIDPGTGALTELSRSPSYGPLPSYCAVDDSRRYLIVSNHSGRNAITKTVLDVDGSYRIVREYDETAVVLFPLDGEGRIQPPCDIVRHTGHGALPNQQNPHAHSVKRSPDGKLFAVCDKGNDSLYFYRIDQEKNKLICCDRIDGVPGSSPRYSAFHPTLPYLYYNNETKSIVNVVRYDEAGKLTPVCAVSCMADGDEQATGMQSDLCIDPTGRNLYSLVRDNATIAVFRLGDDGMPTFEEAVPCSSTQGGRGLAIAPDGKRLYLAAFPDKEVRAFAIGKDGRLTPDGIALEDRAPGVVVFFSAPDAKG